MARKIEVELVGDSRSLERAFSRSQTSGQKLSRGISTLAKVAAAGAVALGAGLAVGAKKSVEAASNLEEQINKTKVVFRGSEKAILSWSKKTATSFGISERAALEATGTFGNMLVPMGFARKEAGEMSTAMVELAADMASFNNASPEETLLALRSGLAGESEPLRKFGVFLNEARVKQEALRLGLVKGNEELSDQEKAFARYSLIMKDTKDAQGDFARTSDSLANSQRTLKAVIENIGASIGKKLLPFVADAAKKLSDFLGKISQASGIKAKLRIVWLGLSGAVKDLFDQLSKALMGGREVLKVHGDAVVWEKEGLLSKLQEVLQGLDWTAIGQTIGENISSKVKITADFIGRILSAANAFIDSHTDQFANLGAKMLLSIVSKLMDPGFWKDNWKLILGIGIAVFPLGRVVGLSVKISKALLSPLAKLVPAGFRTIGSRAVDALLSVLSRLPGVVQRIFLSVVDNAIKALKQLVGWIQGQLRAALARVPGWVKAAFRLSAVIAFFNLIKDLASAVQDLIGWISRIDFPDPPGWLGGALEGAVRTFVPRAASGGNIKRTGLAMVHRGESVTPARIQRTSFGGNGGGPGQFALVYAGADFIGWLQDQDRRTRRGNGGQGILS